MEQRETTFETTKVALEAQLTEGEARPDAAPTGVTAHRDLLRDKVDRLSSDRSVPSVELKTTRCQLSAARIEIETVSGMLTDQKRLREEAEKRTADVQYELDGAKVKITEFEGRVQEGVGHILGQAGRLNGGIHRIRDHFVKNLQLNLQNYIRTAFAALKTTRTHRGRLGGSVHAANNNITDGLKALHKTVEGLRGPSANGK